ncbi:MAG: pilus assembly protein TadG-related protein [Candidatus Brocadiales bacterium]
MSFIKKYFGSNRGVVAIIVAASATVMFGMLALSTDMGYLFLVRNQLQNAADAGALAGASKLPFLLNGTIGSSGEVRDEAITYATQYLAAERMVEPGDIYVILNLDGTAWAVDDDGQLVVPPDLSFLSAETLNVFLSNSPSVMVIIRRTQETTPITLFVGQVLGQPQAGVSAVAVAKLLPVGETCGFKPWLIRDKPYLVPNDIGVLVTLKYSSQPNADREEPGWFSPVQFPPITRPECGSPVPGSSAYKEHIQSGSSCDCIFGIGDILELETGNMVGPTVQGVKDLISTDPGAEYNPDTGTVVGSIHGDWTQSERIAKLLLFPPDYVLASNTREAPIAKIAAFFIESVEKTGNKSARVNGYFIGISTSGGSGLVGQELPDDEYFLFRPVLLR